MEYNVPKITGYRSKLALHWWLYLKDSDGCYLETIILQWAPYAGKWCSSGNVGTGIYYPEVRLHNAEIMDQVAEPDWFNRR